MNYSSESEYLNAELARHKPGRSERTITCPNCKGSGIEELSCCCLHPVTEKVIINGIRIATCGKCKEREYYGCDCDRCDGYGKITL